MANRLLGVSGKCRRADKIGSSFPTNDNVAVHAKPNVSVQPIFVPLDAIVKQRRYAAPPRHRLQRNSTFDAHCPPWNQPRATIHCSAELADVGTLSLGRWRP